MTNLVNLVNDLSNLVNNLSEGIHRIKCKFGHDYKKCETCEIKYKHCNCFLKYINFKDDLLQYKCSICNKNCQIKLYEKLKEQFFNTYEFSNHDNNKFILLLRKGVYPYEYMDNWEKFKETSLPEKGDFCSHLNLEDITDADITHSDTLFLVDVFENFRNMRLEIHKLDPAHFLSLRGLAWQAASERIKVKLDLLTDIDMLLLVEKRIIGEICHSIYWYAKANNKYMKNIEKKSSNIGV